MMNNALFYTCSLIEFIGRERKLRGMMWFHNWERKRFTESINIRMCFIVIP